MWMVNRQLAKVIRRLVSMNPTWKYAGVRDKIVAQTFEGFSFYIDIRRGTDTLVHHEEREFCCCRSHSETGRCDHIRTNIHKYARFKRATKTGTLSKLDRK